jgi:hypothetical protein
MMPILVDDGLARDSAFAGALVERSGALGSDRPLLRWRFAPGPSTAVGLRRCDPRAYESAPPRFVSGPIVSAMSTALETRSVEGRWEPGRAAACFFLYVRSLWLRSHPELCCSIWQSRHECERTRNRGDNRNAVRRGCGQTVLIIGCAGVSRSLLLNRYNVH